MYCHAWRLPYLQGSRAQKKVAPTWDTPHEIFRLTTTCRSPGMTSNGSLAGVHVGRRSCVSITHSAVTNTQSPTDCTSMHPMIVSWLFIKCSFAET